MAKPSIVAHHDPAPTYYTLTESELDNVGKCGRNAAKENTLFCIGLFLPTLANCIPDLMKAQFVVTVPLFLNSVIATCTLLMGLFQARNWWQTRNDFKNSIKALREKPLMNLVINPLQAGNVVTGNADAGAAENLGP